MGHGKLEKTKTEDRDASGVSSGCYMTFMELMNNYFA